MTNEKIEWKIRNEGNKYNLPIDLFEELKLNPGKNIKYNGNFYWISKNNGKLWKL